MSTRATYRFKHEYFDVTFYIHYDGYPSGAADYFKVALGWEAHRDNPNETFAERFFLACPYARFTKSHEAHGDTEYRYTAQLERGGSEWKFSAEEYKFDDEWETFFVGTVESFVEKFGGES